MNRKILMSLGAIVFVTALSLGATGAFFSDSEVSTGNVLAAGEIDLGIDNHSYYNGILQNGVGGTATTTWRIDYDIDTTEYPGDNPATLDVVEDGYSLPQVRQFFNFRDLKPGDWGEDTISIHVKDNDSYVCADVTLTSDNDNGVNEPEGDAGDVTPGVGEGELADHLNFFWWADDGDNVYETCQGEDQPEQCVSEELLPAGPLGALAVGQTATVALADSNENIWGDQGPLPGDSVRYIGKAWCFGTSAMAPYPQDGGNQQNGPDNRPVVCDGTNEGNITQTDSVTMDIGFRAVQSRHNGQFQCNPETGPTPVTSLSLAKTVTPANVAADALFTLTATGPTNLSGIEGSAGASGAVSPGVYTLGETGGPIGATATWSCVGNATPEAGNTVTIAANEQVSCEVTNTYALTQCTDGVDNDDVDQLVDQSDPQCHTDGNAANATTYDPTDNAEGPDL